MTSEELKKLIAGDEGETVEVKETTGQRVDACETLCAFLNKDGGTVVFGVTKKGKLTGQLVFDKTKREMFEVFAKFEPSADIDASGSNLDQNQDRAIVRQGPDHGGIWRISRRVAQNGVLNPGPSEVAEKPNKVAEKVAVNPIQVAEKVAENSSQVAENVAEKQGEYTENPSEYTEKYTETRSEYTEKVAEKLSETEERIVALIQSNAHITQKMLSEAIGLTRQYVGRCMDSLQARKIIRRIGPDKGGHWEVVSP